MDTTVLKKPVLLTILLFNVFCSFGQFKTVVDVGSIENKTLKAKIDKNVSNLLSEINLAFTNKTVPSLAGIEMSDSAKSAVLALWETSPFRSGEDEIYEDILNLKSGGMELRNIMLFMTNADSTHRNQEGVIVFTKTGVIDNFYLSIGTSQYEKVMAEGKDITDMSTASSG